MRFIVVSAMAILLCQCISTSGHLNYNKHNAYSGDSAGNTKFQEVSPVETEHWSWAWKNCDAVVDSVTESLKRKAEGHGGDAVVDVRFLEDDVWVKQPSCTKNWIFLYSWSKARGTAVKLAH